MYCTEVLSYESTKVLPEVLPYESTFESTKVRKYFRSCTSEVQLQYNYTYVYVYGNNKLLVTKKLINKIVYDMSVWVWAYVQYVVHVQRPTTLYVYNVVVVLYVRCTRTCTVVPSYFRKYESTFVLSKIIHPYNRSSTNTTTTYEGTCTTLYNVRVQNTYESTVHVLYTRTTLYTYSTA